MGLIAIAFSWAHFWALNESNLNTAKVQLCCLHVDELLLWVSAENKRGKKVFIARFPTGVFYVGWDVCQQYNIKQIPLPAYVTDDWMFLTCNVCSGMYMKQKGCSCTTFPGTIYLLPRQPPPQPAHSRVTLAKKKHDSDDLTCQPWHTSSWSWLKRGWDCTKRFVWATLFSGL